MITEKNRLEDEGDDFLLPDRPLSKRLASELIDVCLQACQVLGGLT